MTVSNDKPNSPRPAAAEADGWEATRAQTALATQIMRDDGDDPSLPRPDVGKLSAPNVHELFVSCAPAEALQQQFEHLAPEFIALHDVGTASSRKLLAGIAGASGRALQKLMIRRQGHGNTLAALDFLELPTTDGSSLRLYTTDTDADPAVRTALALSLLGHSRLGAVMVGDAPTDSIAAAFKPLRDAMLAGHWRNRHLLLLPLNAASALVGLGMELASGTGVNVRTTPQVTRPADAWNFITGSWARLREHTSAGGPGMPGLGSLRAAASERAAAAVSERQSAETQPMPMLPMPEIPRAGAAAPPAPASLLQRYVEQLAQLAGMVSCCVFDLGTGRDLHHAGARPRAADLGARGSDLLAAISAASRSLGLGHALPEAAITLGAHHLLLRAVPHHPGLALHAVLDRSHANLTLARLQVQRMDEMFEPRSPR